MTRLVATLLLAAALTGCASKTETAAPATATTAAGPASPARTKACQQFTAFFTSLREQAKSSGSGWTPEQGAEELLSTMRQSPSWASTSEADRTATEAGIKDAANGTSCG
ncbi:hypothetical protein LTV02_02750 [Nocardia yamanashiensis]|uniref:hypothetical protein n=1 Tax=Nocardia yamanashiensis TaxID=209247 RepID=UPI001E493D32|nr:hypothetical protein [Nocardia yamanashiensis]UGT42359.1 hypothetical protein LTV02_02750 [Nocardia yamanashiensis]